MNSYARSMVMGGAARGLSAGLQTMERQDRQRQQDLRLAEQDRRANERDSRDAEYHELRMRQGEGQLDDAEMQREHAAFAKNMDDALGQFLLSEGADTAAIEQVYNEQYPDGNQMKIMRGEDGSYVLDFGEKGQSQPMSAEQVAGMVSVMKDPSLYMAERKAAAEQARARAIEVEDANTKHSRAIELERVKAGLKPPKEPTYKTADNGALVAVQGGRATPVEAGGLTFKGERAGSAKQSAWAGDVDTIASKLEPLPGESEDQRWLRAAEEKAKLVGKNDPNAAVRDFEKSITAKLLGPDTISTTMPERLEMTKQTIRQLVEDFAQRYGAEAQQQSGPPPGAPTATNPQTGEKVYWDGTAWQLQ